MKLIVGLGNPGKEYQNTRHNIGFMMLDVILKSYNLECDKTKFSGLYCELILNGEKFIFLKPQKYINLSGEVIKKYIDYFKINIDDLLIVHDDLDISIGKYKLKSSGSSGGHNGLKNIELNIGSDIYNRFKIGISNNKDIDTKDYVLGKLSDEELIEINKIFQLGMNLIKDYVNMTFVELMNKYNKK